MKIEEKRRLVAAIDKFFYGSFEHYRRIYREDFQSVCVEVKVGENWCPITDWLEKGKMLSPENLLAFADYFLKLAKNTEK